MKRNFTVEQYLLVGVLVGLFFWVAYPVINAVFLGLFLAMVVQPWHVKLVEKEKISNSWSALLLTLGVIIWILLPISYIAIIVTKDAARLTTYLTTLTSGDANSGENFKFSHFVDVAFSKIPDSLSITRDEFADFIQRSLASIGNLLGKLLGGAALSVPELLLDLVFVIMALFYGLADGATMAKFIKDLLPFSRSEVETFVSTSQQIVQGVVVGSLLAGVVQGLIIGIGFAALSIPRPVFFGVMTLTFSFVPMLGSLPAGIGGAIYLFATGRPVAGCVMLAIFGIASVSDNVVKPMALKGQSELHPLIGFISVIGGLAVFGFSGLFLGPLAAALALVALEILRDNRQSARTDYLNS